MSKTWIVYEAESRNAHDWNHRMLLPFRGLTNLLAEVAWMVTKIQKFSSFDAARIVCIPLSTLNGSS